MLRSLIASKAVRFAAGGVLALASVGCETKSFLDPAQVGRFEKDPLTVPIMDTLGLGTDELDAQFVGARDVTAEDLVESKVDYLIGPNDTIQVTISDLVGPGTETTKTLRVSASGKVSLPSLTSPVTASGLSEQQLEVAIKQAYADAQIITSSTISVAVVEARGRTYNILGAIGGPGPYAIYDADFRLMNAIATARDVTSAVGIDWVYVVRKKDASKTGTAGGMGSTTAPATQPTGADPLAPTGMAPDLQPRKSAMLQTGKAPAGSIVVVDGKEVVVTSPTAATMPDSQLTGSMPEGAITTTGGMTSSAPFAFNTPPEPTDREVIRVPYNKLKQGELKYNIVVHPGDFIYVAQPSIGEYYIGGNVQAPGAYSLNARKITLKEAITAARGLNEVAWPSRTDVIRRLPGDKEAYVRVDLDKIFSGQQPDLYLKPDDHVIVGTNALAPFLGAIRNGFRLTYGFGFLYDRNYYDQNNNN